MGGCRLLSSSGVTGLLLDTLGCASVSLISWFAVSSCARGFFSSATLSAHAEGSCGESEAGGAHAEGVCGEHNGQGVCGEM